MFDVAFKYRVRLAGVGMTAAARVAGCIYLVLIFALGCGPSVPPPSSAASLDDAGERGVNLGDPAVGQLIVERVTTKAPFPRGLVLLDGVLYVLSRGRARDTGGVSGEIDDMAGTIWRVDPTIVEPITQPGTPEVADNGVIFAAPTSPPFQLFDRTASPPTLDRWTDRPYCTLRYHAPTKSFYLCAFSGIDKPRQPGQRPFSKNLTDALLRYDTRTNRWYEVERHTIEAGGAYPHHDPTRNQPPHGWLSGPDNCLALGHWLYAVAKDNNVLVRYDLRALESDPEAGPPPSELIFGAEIEIAGQGKRHVFGHSMLAAHGEFLYVGFRTTSEVIRLKLLPDGTLQTPLVAELVAQFEPWNPDTGKSANLTDMDIDAQGRVYVISAEPSRVFRFTPDPRRVFDAGHADAKPWADLAAITGNPRMKSENVLVGPDGTVFVTAGDAYGHDPGLGGVVYRVREAAP